MWPFTAREEQAAPAILDDETKAAPPAVERATLSSPDDELYLLLTGGYGTGTASGESVGPNSALRVPAVLAAVRVIANTVASLDVRVMRLQADGVALEDFEHPANAILARPAPWSGRFTYFQTLTFDALKHGVGYAVANRLRGEVRELIRIRPGSLACDLNLDTGEPSYRYGDRVYPWQDVVHVQPIPSDNGELTSIVNLAREGIGFAGVLQKHGARLFANGAKPGGILSVKPSPGEKTVSPTVLKRVAEVWSKTFGGGGAGKTAALPADVSYESLAMNSVDAQYLDLWKLAILEIARAFGVPPQFLQDLERTTHSNAEELGLQFVQFCIAPFCGLFTEAHERVLFTDDERNTYFIEFDYSDLLRPNTQALFDAMQKGVVGGVLTPNNARRRIGEQPVKGGDTLLVPLNTRPVDQPQPIAQPATPPAPTPEPVP
ncbi:phage portal protein [Methylobacterium sp. J-088]|uniref:phage portal protein n=1 Tax=Methylobacterium sp. J-088 TaxID=2836664 RepID=UPI001FB86E0B|nr:phage portal protein [Methylobacterium sp. J-088]MCJ2065041.1 phage portal protein [Methylobacterium sp. J-088]